MCLINQKGGCGKSSSCFHLAGAFAAAGCRVLLLDADPQGSLSQGFLGSAAVEGLPPEATLAALFDGDQFAPSPESLIVATAVPNITLLPSNQHLAWFNTPRPEQAGLQQFVVREWLNDLSDVDLVLIDCPPNLYACSWAAMLAADYVVIPVPPEDFGTQGLRAVHQAIDQVRLLNPKLRRLGHLITRSDRRLNLHRLYEERLRSLYSELVLDTVIPEAVAYKVALTARLPVEQHDPGSTAAGWMRQLADELCARIESRQSQRQAA